MEILRQGSRGPYVELFQTALTRAGYYGGVIDGVFGPLTRQAAMNFQAAYGLAADGVIGPLTWSALTPFLTGYTPWTIQAGDTLFALSRRFGTTVEAILAANPGIVPSNLTVGSVITVPLGFDVVPDSIAFTYDLLSFCVDGLTARYPFIRAEIIGRSVQGKALYALAVGGGPNEVMYNASHHANEWITTPVLMRFLEQYAAAYSGAGRFFGGAAREIYEKTTIYFVPMVNPDGVDLVTGATPPGSAPYESARALNYLRLPFPSGWKANIRGVDLNLQYPAGWELAREYKYSQGYIAPGPRDYVGPSPLSEPESSAMFDFTRAHNFSLTLSYHTQGEVIYWRYADYMPPRSYEIVRLLSGASGYAFEETPHGSGHAGYKDWFIQAFNRPGYTIECGLGVSPLPLSQFGRIYRDNIGILALSALV
ncbi:MAG: M14 family metallopeptidase [Oscillospiraceae bacterium]|nr:M14 family metallopeptidase [Oscillospiraceae bacterium]